MKVESSVVNKLLITEVERLDPITVILEDLGPRQGKIHIECYGQSWSAYWGGMGNRTVAQFFCSCDEHYLAKNLSSVRSHVTDYDGIIGKVEAQINEDIKELLVERRYWNVSQNEAREKYERLLQAKDDIPTITCEVEMHINADFMHEVFGEEWWCVLPEKTNDDYLYLCQIINAVQDGLNQQKAAEAA